MLPPHLSHMQSHVLDIHCRPPSHLAQALNSALPSGPGNSSSSRSSKRQRGAVTAEVQREIEEALPVRGSFKEKYGAAGEEHAKCFH